MNVSFPLLLQPKTPDKETILRPEKNFNFASDTLRHFMHPN